MPTTTSHTSINGIASTHHSVGLEGARRGDREAFDTLIAPLRDQLLAHCYRMLGSIHDADDALQDTMLRAWKGFPGFDGRSEFSTWLYRIATNASLDAISRNARRVLPVDLTVDEAAGAEAARWIEPFAHAIGPESPEAVVVRRESVELAFVTALQILPANQRAVLLLRDVLAFSADDTAAILGASVTSVTSSLQRARRTVEQRLPDDDPASGQSNDSERRRPIGSPPSTSTRGSGRTRRRWSPCSAPTPRSRCRRTQRGSRDRPQSPDSSPPSRCATGGA